jgi:hypothetical protein
VDEYGEGELLNPAKGYMYITIVGNLSQIWAMYCLMHFYHELHDSLSGLKPLPKLLCIKAVVFFTFWQSMLISLLGNLNVLHGVGTYSLEDLEWGLSNILICVEMFLAALAHRKYFAFTDFQAGSGRMLTWPAALLDTIMPHDRLRDLKSRPKAE